MLVRLESKKNEKKSKMSDREVLYGFFFASRYITKNVRDKYGLNTSLYDVRPNSLKMNMLHKRLSEYVLRYNTIDVNSCEDLRNLLGSEFNWVNFSYEEPRCR